jgi:hypothetical protein
MAHVLEGSVQAGNSVRITAQLIRAGTDTHLRCQTMTSSATSSRSGRDCRRRGQAAQSHAARRGTERARDRPRGVRYTAGQTARTRFTAEAFSSPTRCTARCWRSIRATPRPGAGWLATSASRQAKVFARRGRIGQAREAATLVIDPDYAPARPTRLDRDIRRQRPAGAAQHSARALALDPADASALT